MRLSFDIDTDDWTRAFVRMRNRMIRKAFPRQMAAVDAVASIAYYVCASPSKIMLDQATRLMWKAQLKLLRNYEPGRIVRVLGDEP